VRVIAVPAAAGSCPYWATYGPFGVTGRLRLLPSGHLMTDSVESNNPHLLPVSVQAGVVELLG
jgi:hypothetical protein